MNNIANLLPHSGIMVLVDEIVFIDESSIVVKSMIKPSPFVKEGKFASYQLIELMAQALGVYKGMHSNGLGGDVAFLIGSRKFEIFKPFLNLGDEIIIKALLSIQDDSGFGVYDCEVFLGEELVSSATISVLNPTKEKFLELKNG